MSAQFTAVQTPTGWQVVLDGCEHALVVTEGDRVSIKVTPDVPVTTPPLVVSLGTPEPDA